MGLSNVRSPLHAEVVKLVDTLASGASARKGVEVQVLSSAPFPSAPHLTVIKQRSVTRLMNISFKNLRATKNLSLGRIFH